MSNAADEDAVLDDVDELELPQPARIPAATAATSSRTLALTHFFFATVTPDRSKEKQRGAHNSK
jgi:hypothetical protein